MLQLRVSPHVGVDWGEKERRVHFSFSCTSVLKPGWQQYVDNGSFKQIDCCLFLPSGIFGRILCYVSGFLKRRMNKLGHGINVKN